MYVSVTVQGTNVFRLHTYICKGVAKLLLLADADSDGKGPLKTSKWSNGGSCFKFSLAPILLDFVLSGQFPNRAGSGPVGLGSGFYNYRRQKSEPEWAWDGGRIFTNFVKCELLSVFTKYAPRPEKCPKYSGPARSYSQFFKYDLIRSQSVDMDQ
jgi:hypothetical protein